MAHSDLQHSLVRGRKLALGALGGALAVVGVVVALFAAGIVRLPSQQSANETAGSAEAAMSARALETQATGTLSNDDVVAVLNSETKTLAFMTWQNKNSSTTYAPMGTWWNADPGSAFTSSSLPGWTLYRSQIEKVVFEGPVAPTSTAYWFAYLENLKSIERMATNLDTSDTINMDAMFLNCSQLPDSYVSSSGLDVSNFKMNKVRTARAMFSGCSVVSVLDLSNWSGGGNDTSKIADWGSMFAQCGLLNNIQGLDNLDTSSATNMSYLFADCPLLSTLNLFSWDTTKVVNTRCMFYRCAGLTMLRLGPNSANLDTGAGVLDGCYIPPTTNVIG